MSEKKYLELRTFTIRDTDYITVIQIYPSFVTEHMSLQQLLQIFM